MGVRSVILFLSPLLKLFVIAWAALVSKVYYNEGGENIDANTFFIEGQQLMEQERQEQEDWGRLQEQCLNNNEVEYNKDEQVELLEGKLKQEELKKALFEYLCTTQ